MNVRVAGDAFQGGPVAKQDMGFRRQLLKNEPGLEALGSLVKAFLDGEIQLAAFLAEAHTGQVVGNQSETVIAFKRVLPLARLIAIHIDQEFTEVRSAQST